MQPTEQLRTTLKLDGASLTRPRQLVFEALRIDNPLTMSELLKSLSNKIDRASIYRTIQLFEKLGVVQRLQIGWKYKLELSDNYSPHHHHLTCLNCNKVLTINEEKQLERQILSISRKHNFTATDHQIEIRGICAECHAKNVGN